MSKAAYANETVGSLMATNVPTCHESETVAGALKILAQPKWADSKHLYIVNSDHHLKSTVTLSRLLKAAPIAKIRDLEEPVIATVLPSDDQELAVFEAVKNDLDSVPVVENGKFLGVVTAKSLIDVMHDEHFEDTLISAGIRHDKGTDIVKLATSRLTRTVRSRAPWLIGGAVAGIALGYVSSWFETSLQANIALAYFIPVIAYIADSVGTQSEAITVRALATLKLNYMQYLGRELFIGLALGIILGVMGGVGAALISWSVHIGIVVFVALIAASTIATLLASAIPMTFKALGKDPALGSGPIATALQDLISIVIYFFVAIVLLK